MRQRTLPTTPKGWHRFFAVETNNLAWSLSEACTQGVPKPELLDAAHASAWHWHAVGTDENRMRSVMLLALVHARFNLGTSAWQYAEHMRDFFLARSETPDWELALVHTIHALAARAHGNAIAFEDSRSKAERAVKSVQDPIDREIVDRTYRLLGST